MRARALLLALFVVAANVVVAAPAVAKDPAGAGPGPGVAAGSATGVNSTGRRVSVAALPDYSAGGGRSARLPAAAPTPAGPPASAAALPSAAAVAPFSASGSSLAISASFAGAAAKLCGTVPCADPADPWIGVGPSHVVEATAESIRITDRAGVLLKETSLVGFFGGSASGQREARISWDVLHSRWVAVERDDDCVSGFVSIASSDTTDPTGSWTVWVFSRAGYAADMPSIGISSDKVMVGVRWQGMTPAPGGCTRTGAGGAGGFVVDSNSLYQSGQSLPFLDLGVVASVAAWRPALAVTQGQDLQIVAALPLTAPNYGWGYARITGTLALENMTRTAVSDLTGAGPKIPAWRSVSSLGHVLANEWQPLDALWHSGVLWAVVQAVCTPAGDTAARPCLRIVSIATGATPALLDDVAVGVAGKEVYPGGIGVDRFGALVASWSQANVGSTIVSTFASHRLPADVHNTLRPPIALAAGAAAYMGQEWGQYQGIAFDPSDPSAAWVVAPYSAAGGGWGTKIVRVEQAHPLRFWGADRFEAAQSISANTFPAGASFGAGVDAVYVANAYNFPDALAAAAAAGTIKGPVLLTAATGTLNAATRAELVRLKPKKIIVVGGTASVDATIITQLAPLAPVVSRYAGPDRFTTAQQISQYTFPAGASFGTGVDAAYVANAYKFPDALAAAAAAGRVKGPVLLTAPTGTLNAATKAELVRLKPKKIIVVGGEVSVDPTILTQLGPLAPIVTRYAGPDRFTAAQDISENTFPGAATIGTGVDRVYIANAYNFPDALAGAAAAGYIGGPVLLTPATGSLPQATIDELNRLNPKVVVICGGPNSVGTDIEGQLAAWVA